MLTKLRLRNEFANATDHVSEDLISSAVFDLTVNQIISELI